MDKLYKFADRVSALIGKGRLIINSGKWNIEDVTLPQDASAPDHEAVAFVIIFKGGRKWHVKITEMSNGNGE